MTYYKINLNWGYFLLAQKCVWWLVSSWNCCGILL